MLFLCGIFNAYLVVFSLYLAITKRKQEEEKIEEKYYYFDKSG